MKVSFTKCVRVRLSAVGIAAAPLLAWACGSEDQARRAVPDAGGGGAGSGAVANAGGARTGGATGSGGTPGGGGRLFVDAGAGGNVPDATLDGDTPDVSVPDDSGTSDASDAATTLDARGEAGPFIPVLDAGTGCELPPEGPVVTPEGASLPSAGLVTWLRGDRGVYRTASSAVCAWVDQSGSGFVFTPDSPASRPQWGGTGIGSQAGITFGTNQHLGDESVLGLPAQSARTIVVVAQHVSTSARFYAFVQGNYSNTFTYLGIDANTFNTAGGLEGVYMHGNAYDSTLATTTETRVHVYVIGPMTIGTPILAGIRYRVNGAELTLTRTPGGTGNGNFESFASAHRTRVGSGSASTILGEVLVYDHALSDPDITQVESALEARYAIP